MLAAARAMRGRAEAALGDLAKAPLPDGKAEMASRLKGLAAEADSVVSFGESLWSPDAGEEVHEKAENSLRRGIVAYYRLGQLLAMPELLERPEITAATVTGPVLPLPGQPGWDRSPRRWRVHHRSFGIKIFLSERPVVHRAAQEKETRGMSAVARQPGPVDDPLPQPVPRP